MISAAYMLGSGHAPPRENFEKMCNLVRFVLKLFSKSDLFV